MLRAFSRQWHELRGTCGRSWDMLRHKAPGQVTFWLIALVVGAAAGASAVIFRFGINRLQAALYGTEDVNTLASFARELPWVWVLLIPVAGGLVVGVILQYFTPDGRVRSVSDVIEGAALNDQPQLPTSNSNYQSCKDKLYPPPPQERARVIEIVIMCH